MEQMELRQHALQRKFSTKAIHAPPSPAKAPFPSACDHVQMIREGKSVEGSNTPLREVPQQLTLF